MEKMPSVVIEEERVRHVAGIPLEIGREYEVVRTFIVPERVDRFLTLSGETQSVRAVKIFEVIDKTTLTELPQINQRQLIFGERMSDDTEYREVRVEIRYSPNDKVAEIFRRVAKGEWDALMSADQMKMIDAPGFEYYRRPPSHPKNLTQIYNVYQVVDSDDTERTHTLDERAMTIGDAIVVDGRAYYVLLNGFGTVEVVDGTKTVVLVTEENCGTLN